MAVDSVRAARSKRNLWISAVLLWAISLFVELVFVTLLGKLSASNVAVWIFVGTLVFFEIQQGMLVLLSARTMVRDAVTEAWAEILVANKCGHLPEISFDGQDAAATRLYVLTSAFSADAMFTHPAPDGSVAIFVHRSVLQSANQEELEVALICQRAHALLSPFPLRRHLRWVQIIVLVAAGLSASGPSTSDWGSIVVALILAIVALEGTAVIRWTISVLVTNQEERTAIELALQRSTSGAAL